MSFDEIKKLNQEELRALDALSKNTFKPTLNGGWWINTKVNEYNPDKWGMNYGGWNFAISQEVRETLLQKGLIMYLSFEYITISPRGLAYLKWIR